MKAYNYVYSSFVNCSPKLENQSCKTSYSRSYLGMLVSNKKLTIVHTHKSLCDSRELCWVIKRLFFKIVQLYTVLFHYIIFLKCQRNVQQILNSSCLGVKVVWREISVARAVQHEWYCVDETVCFTWISLNFKKN